MINKNQTTRLPGQKMVVLDNLFARWEDAIRSFPGAARTEQGWYALEYLDKPN